MTILSEDFHKHLRSTLNHLYNPDYLRSSLLASLLGLGGRFTTPITLQEIITNAIDSLKSASFGPADSQPLFYYDLLYYRYIQKLSQKEVANQLGVSVRQFAREQERAIDLLARQIIEQHPSLAEAVAGLGDKMPQAGQGKVETLEDELSWLEKELPGQPVNLAHEMETVLELVVPLASQHHMRIETDLNRRLPDLVVHPVTLRQALLTVINVAIHQKRGEKILIQSAVNGKMATITISTTGESPAPEPGIHADDRTSLDLAARLIEKNSGSVTTQSTEDSFLAQIILPAFFRQVVLLIDDNQDFHHLVQRYLFGTRYQLVSTNNPDQAVELAGKHAAQLILLDVMMPEIDGWQVLGQLRRNPKTSHIPVVICTIIAQEDLAYSLGASAYLRKPVTREMLVATLDRLAGSAAPGSG